MKKLFGILLCYTLGAMVAPLLAQAPGSEKTLNKDAEMITKIFEEALSNGKSYEYLDYLCNRIGGRLSGSPEAARAVEWGKQLMESLEFDQVSLQECMVPHWVRGDAEKAMIIRESGSTEVPICALGGSIGTGAEGLKAGVVEVHQFEELAKLGADKLQGKIVFYNRPMDPKHYLTFHAYGGCVDQRWEGAMQAAKYGATGVVVRSMNLRLDDYPHTGSMGYDDSVKKIPAVAISTNGAELLSKRLKEDPGLNFYFRTTCETLPDEKSYNVVGEIRGTEFPDEIILVGGHLDAWDNGDGAHDDGAGCVQSIEAIRLLKALGVKPKRTLRAVLFMNEENGGRGATAYADMARQKGENHIAAIESDAGGFSPRGFSIKGTDAQIQRIAAWRDLLEPWGLHDFGPGYGGPDINKLEGQGDVVLIGLKPDSQRYFDYHHAPNDTFDAINKRELELGGASLAALIYLLSEYGM